MKKSLLRLLPTLVDLLLLLPFFFQLVVVAVYFLLGVIVSGVSRRNHVETVFVAGLVLVVLIVAYVCFRVGRRRVRKNYGDGMTRLSQNFFMRYLGVVIACGYTVCVALVAIFLTPAELGGIFGQFDLVFASAHLTSSLVVALATMFATPSPWPFLAPPLAIYACYMAGMMWEFRVSGAPRAHARGGILFVAAFVACAALFGWRVNMMQAGYVSSVFGGSGMDDQIYTWNYDPTRGGNRLVKIEKPSLTIGSEYPPIDGATALYPVYAAAFRAIYKNVDNRSGTLIGATTTPQAYERLVQGAVDVIFCAQPSREQTVSAKAKGVEFQLTPIGSEAFVFFVNEANPVDGLTTEQIRAIYKKEITNWSKVGGHNTAILPFQRQKDSGSQTAMEMRVMRGEPMAAPLKEEYNEGMGEIVRRTAAYRNAPNAIGYSFRFFVTTMADTKGIKLLKIDGVAPTVETIRDGSYPYAGNFYAVTTNKTANNPHVQELIAWFFSPQGQKLIEDSGYVSLQGQRPDS